VTTIHGNPYNKRKLMKWGLLVVLLGMMSVFCGHIIDRIDFAKHRSDWWVWPLLISLAIPCLIFVGTLMFLCVEIMRVQFRDNNAD
jgi:hypothetical protein